MSKVFKAVGNAVKSVVKAVVNVVSTVVKAVVNVVSSVVNFVTQPFMGMLGGMPDVPSATQEADRQQGVLIQTQGSNVSIPVVYGYRKVGGTVVFAETGSTNNRYLYVAYVFSEGLVEGLREVYIDDFTLPTNLTANLNAGQVVDVNADRYNGRVRLQWYPGQYFSNVSQSPVGAAVKSGIFAEAPGFKDTMDFNGLAVLFARYEWKEIRTQADSDNNPFNGSIPQLQVAMLGVRVASLLVAAENTEYEAAPVRYSTNPAEILLDYLRNPRYGKGLRNADIHWPTFKAAARKCNQTVTYLTSGGIQGPILSCNAVIPTDQTIFANVKTLLMGFRAYMPYVQGKYKLKIEDAGNEYDILSGSAVIFQTFTKDDMIGDVTYTGIERSAKYNVVSISYVDPDQKFSVQQVIYPETEAERQTYIDLDGGRENKLDATFPTLTNYAMAKDMARLLFNKSRRQETCSITVTSKALELEPGDCIRIQSNILNFGTDPWRIVSFKLNEDMSVDLGCVRNPDDIYPYVRVGEEDYVVPLFIPKGSIIYFPGSENRQPLGLLPPTNAVFPDQYTATPTHPPSTDPNAPGGGGPGGGNPPEGPGPIVPPEQPQPPITVPVPPDNTPPEPAPIPPPFDAVLTVRSSRFNNFNNGTYSFSIDFIQPQAGLYSHSIIWYRYNVRSNWIEQRLDTRPGPGGTIPYTLGPLPAGIYDFYVRSFATDGRSSSRVLQGQLGSRQDLIELGRAGLLSVSTQTVTEGWAVPQPDQPVVPRYDDNIDVFELRPVLSSGQPTNPRTVRISMQQITNTLSAPINTEISGVRVYYKARSDDFYTFEDLNFPDNYLPGQIFNATLAGDFGSPAFPNDIIPFTATDQLQKFDFIIRLNYRNGTRAEKQLGPFQGASVELYQGLYDYVICGTNPLASRSGRSQLIPAGFQIPTTDQDPNKDNTVSLAIIPGIWRITSSRTSTRVTWQFNAVANSKFRGFKIRWRPVQVGADPDYYEATTSVVANIDNRIVFDLESPNYQFNTTYDILITAQISTSTGIQDATNSLYARYSISNDDPNYADLTNAMNFQTKDTQIALGQLRDAFPGVPVVNAITWRKRFGSPVSTSGAVWDFTKSSSLANDFYYINHWYELKFQVPASATGIILYRRSYTPLYPTTVGTSAKYFGLGQWERVRVALSSLTLSEGFYTINVRGPIHHTYFNSYYEVSGGPNSGNKYSSIYSPTWPFSRSLASGGLSGMYPYAGAGNNPANASSTRFNQFMFVVEDANTEQTKGLMLRDFSVASVNGLFPNGVDGFQCGGVTRDQVIEDTTIFNQLDSGYDRRLQEALTAPAFNKLTSENIRGNTGSFPNRFPSTNATYNVFLSQPSQGGITVY